MQTLATYLKSSSIRASAFAASVGVSKSYMSELIAGRKMPSLTLAVTIAEATHGAVPVQSWVSAVPRVPESSVPAE